jgi:hypothetical protein
MTTNTGIKQLGCQMFCCWLPEGNIFCTPNTQCHKCPTYTRFSVHSLYEEQVRSTLVMML